MLIIKGSHKDVVNDQRRLLFKNSSWTVIARALRAVEVVIRSVVVARSLGVEAYAHYAIISAFTQPFINVFSANVGTSLIKYGTELREQGRQHRLMALVKLTFLTTSVLYVCFAAVFVVGCYLFKGLFGFDQNILGYVVGYGLAGGVALLGLTGKSLLALYMRFKVNTLVDLVITTVNIIAVIGVALLYAGDLRAILVTIACTMVFGPIACNVAALLELRSEFKGFLGSRITLLKGRFREIFRFTFGNSVARSLDNTTKSVDVLILGSVASEAAVAVYDIARKLASVFFMLKDPIVIAAFPQVVGLLAKGEYDVFKSLLRSVYKVILLPVFCVLVLMVMFDDWILSIWGPGFDDPGWVVLLTMSRTLVPLLCFWSIPLILSLGKVRLRLAAGIVSSSVGFGLAFLLARPFEGEGVACAMLVGALVNQSILMVYGLRAISGDQNPPTNPTMRVAG